MSTTLSIRLSIEDKESLIRESDASGLSLSAFIQEMVRLGIESKQERRKRVRETARKLLRRKGCQCI